MDSFVVIKYYVFDKKIFIMDVFFKVLKNNWKGYEIMREIFCNFDKIFKFGNDDDYVDEIVKRVVDEVVDFIESYLFFLVRKVLKRVYFFLMIVYVYLGRLWE